MRFQTHFLPLVIAVVLSISAKHAGAIGWDNDDFLIGGGPNFTTKIGVFNHDLTFKGLLDNFFGVQGMDFDAAGHLVAVSPDSREVRVYDSSGVRVGGFVRSDDAMAGSDDLKVAPDGSYIIAQHNSLGAVGARQFNPDGTFVKQFADGNIQGVAVVPGNRVWVGGPGITETRIRVYDIGSGVQVGSVSMPGQVGRNSMAYSASTNTVLSVDVPSDVVFESDLSGNFLRRFDDPGVAALARVTRGPDHDVFATSNDEIGRVLRWHADGSFVGAYPMSASLGFANGIVWAGSVPEPNTALILLISVVTPLAQRR